MIPPRKPATLPTRRSALRQIGFGLGAPAGLLASGCSLGPTRCGAGAEPPSPWPAPATTPSSYALLEHVERLVVLMLENRSFDHLFGSLRMEPSYPARHIIDGLTGAEANPDSDGRMVHVHRMPGAGDGSLNPKHNWEAVRDTWNGGRNDRFIRVNEGGNGHEVMGHLVRDQLPLMYALADRFTVCDRWFSSYMGQTWPNRFYLHAATAGGHRGNTPLLLDAPPTVWERMADRCLETKHYCAGKILWYQIAFPLKAMSGNDAMSPHPIEEFFRDAQRGTLPSFAIIDPDYKVNDGFPEHDLSLADAFVASVYRALAESPQWDRTLFVVTFDEHGGYFDHVAPPRVIDPREDFRQLGFRVPSLVIGPRVWEGGVVNTQLEHVSVAATLRTRFGIQSMGPRMDAASDLSACIDPNLLSSTAAPRNLPTVELTAQVASAAIARAAAADGDDPLRTERVTVATADGRPAEERFRSWLRHAQELEAVRIVK